MKTRALAAIISLAVVLAVTGKSQASIEIGDTIKLNRSGVVGGPGGIFNVVSDDNSWPDFQTFCVEITQHIALGTSYKVAGFGDTTTAGGVLTDYAAWLFKSFVNDSLVGFDSTSLSDVNALQLAIWREVTAPTHAEANTIIMSQLSATWYNLYDGVLAAKYLTPESWLDAFNALSDVEKANTSSNPNGYVEVLNLTTLAGGPAQDQLVFQPPSPQPGSSGSAPEPVSFVVWTILATCIGAVRRPAR